MEGGEKVADGQSTRDYALRTLLEDIDLDGCVLTLDALHTTRDHQESSN